jgi:hypothetical protein
VTESPASPKPEEPKRPSRPGEGSRPSSSPSPSSPPSRPGFAKLGGGGSDSLFGGGVDRVARIQTVAAVVLGLALIAIPLYLWRRPRSETVPVTSAADASAPLRDGGLAAIAPPVAPPVLPLAPTLSEAKVMECHDTGPRKTRPEDCDHLAAVEKGFAAAITAGGPCLPTATGGGTLVYVLDASFGRKHHPLELLIPRDGRSLKSSHSAAAAVSACSAAVKKELDGVTLEGVPHGHSRYKIAITATYPAPNGATP